MGIFRFHGIVGDRPALNDHLDIRSHIGNAFCHFSVMDKSITGKFHPIFVQP